VTEQVLEDIMGLAKINYNSCNSIMACPRRKLHDELLIELQHSELNPTQAYFRRDRQVFFFSPPRWRRGSLGTAHSMASSCAPRASISEAPGPS